MNLAIESAKNEAILPLAVRLLTMAAEAEHLLAYWHLAELNYAGIVQKRSCQAAVSVSLQSDDSMYLGRLDIRKRG